VSCAVGAIIHGLAGELRAGFKPVKSSTRMDESRIPWLHSHSSVTGLCGGIIAFLPSQLGDRMIGNDHHGEADVSGSELGTWGGPKVEPGWTRNCLDPWNFVFIYAQGEVRPCCAYPKAIGDLNKTSLKNILNDEPVKKIRRNLLAGTLEGSMCDRCSMRAPIKVDDLKKKVKEFSVIGLCHKYLGRRVTDFEKWP